jgi:co-chaperonin GroES (HSP10)
VINESQLTLGHGGKMKLNTDPFPIGMVKPMDKKVLVRTYQAETTNGKNVVVSDELRNRMIKPHNAEIGVCKENVLWKPAKRVKPTSTILIEKYQRQLEEDQRYRVTQWIKWDRFFEARNRPDQWRPRHTGEPQRRTVQHFTDREPGIGKNPRFADRSGSGNPDRHVNRPDVLCDKEELSQRLEQAKEHIMMVDSWPCKVSSEVHINK